MYTTLLNIRNHEKEIRFCEAELPIIQEKIGPTADCGKYSEKARIMRHYLKQKKEEKAELIGTFNMWLKTCNRPKSKIAYLMPMIKAYYFESKDKKTVIDLYLNKNFIREIKKFCRGF